MCAYIYIIYVCIYIYICIYIKLYISILLCSSSRKESICNAGDTGDMGLILGSGRSPGRGNGNPLQYSSLENTMNRGAWWAVIHRIAKSQT